VLKLSEVLSDVILHLLARWSLIQYVMDIVLDFGGLLWQVTEKPLFEIFNIVVLFFHYCCILILFIYFFFNSYILF